MAKKKTDTLQSLTNDLLSTITPDELFKRQSQIADFKNHALFVPPPQSIEDSFNFGWLRGVMFMTDTLLKGSWYHWLVANQNGFIENPSDIPFYLFSSEYAHLKERSE